jgi:DNA-binding beta-propeller fold protein YncE
VLVVSTRVVSQEGGALENTRMEFTSWSPDLPLLGEFGGFGCGADGFADPTGVTIAGNYLYVVEREGNQVQVVDRDGNLLGFYGHDGTAFGYHLVGSAAGCGENPPVDSGLARPIGGVVVTSAGAVLVGDSENGRVLALTEEGATTVVDELPVPTVVLGFVTGRGLAVTTGPGRFDIYDLTTQSSVASHGGAPGAGRGQFDFRMDEGGIPSLAFMRSAVSDYYLIVEPCNHRVSRYLAPEFQPRGSIGAGARDFIDDASGEPGLEPGSFTGPTGVVVDADRNLFVIDSASSGSAGGRIQRFSSFGTVVWSIDLDYVPGGIAIDTERRELWITNRTESKLMKYAY